jgi:Flp pilus assembly protein TadG
MTTPSLRLSLRRRAGGETGNALVELAVCLPLLVLTLIGTADFARVFYDSIELTNAAGAAALYVAFCPGHSSNPGLMETTATAAVNITGVTAAAARNCQCADDTGTFSATTPANDCTSAVATVCTGGTHRVMTVTVTTTKTFTTLVNFIGIPSTINLIRSATLRVTE